MHSSTFSFERATAAPWRRIILIAVLTALLLLALVETFWRLRGAEPDYMDDLRRWSYFRAQIEDMTAPRDTVLLGASRIQLGWSLQTFRDEIQGAKTVQLAVDGSSPWAILEDIATNTNFAGTLIVSMQASKVLSINHANTLGHVNYFSRSWNNNTRINFLIDDFLQRFLVTRQSLYGLEHNALLILDGKSLPDTRNYLKTSRERERHADYRLVDIKEHRAERIRRLLEADADFIQPSADEWRRNLGKLDGFVRQITSRGGKVVFLRFPTSDETWAREQEMLPREKYWDDMVTSVSGTWIHFQDVEDLEGFDLPDTSHIDQKDRRAFTRIWLKKLRDMGIY